MAFPQVASITQTTDVTVSGGTRNADLPATVDAGDLLLCGTVCDNGADVTGATDSTSDAWTELHDFTGASVGMADYAKDADGDEDGGTLTISQSSNTANATQVYRITAASWSGTLATDVDITGDTAQTSSATPNPPSVTAGWGADDNLFIVFVHYIDDLETITESSSYGSTTQTDGARGANANASLGSFRRELNASSDDPGNASLTASESWVCSTIVIRPAAAGGGGLQAGGLCLMGVGR